MQRRQWHELGTNTRRLIVAGAVAEGTLKVAALIDLARRPSDQVRGSKKWWTLAIVLINSLGAVPLSYFAFGRRPGR